jgi:hypothetical protein
MCSIFQLAVQNTYSHPRDQNSITNMIFNMCTAHTLFTQACKQYTYLQSKYMKSENCSFDNVNKKKLATCDFLCLSGKLISPGSMRLITLTSIQYMKLQISDQDYKFKA